MMYSTRRYTVHQSKILTHRRMGFYEKYGWAHNLKSVKITFWPTSGWLVELRLNTNKCILYCKLWVPHILY